MYTYLVIPFYGQQVRPARTQCHQVTRSPRKMVKAKVGMVPAAEWMLEKLSFFLAWRKLMFV